VRPRLTRSAVGVSVHVPLWGRRHLTLYKLRRDHSCQTKFFRILGRETHGYGLQICLCRENLFGFAPADPDIGEDDKLLVVGVSISTVEEEEN